MSGSHRPAVRFVNRVYPPAAGATGVLLRELAHALVARGWRVEVVTGPGGLSGDVEGVSVRRVRAPFAHGPSSGLGRRAAHLALLYPALLAAAARRPRPDVLVLMTDPPMLVGAAPWLRRRTGARIVHWAQDLYPDVAAALGALRPDGPAERTLRRIAARGLRACDAVVAVGRCTDGRLRARGVRPERLHVVPNWAIEGARPDEAGAVGFRRSHGLEGAFVGMYAGNLGRAHPFAAVLDAARRLRTAAPDVRLVIVGDGPRRGEVEATVTRDGLSNVVLLPPQPAERLGAVLSAADLHLVTQRAGLEGLVVPSKVYGPLAVGRPVLFLGPPEGEAARAVTEAGAGEVLPPDDGAALARAILAWRDDPARRASVRPSPRCVADAVEAFEAVLTGGG